MFASPNCFGGHNFFLLLLITLIFLTFCFFSFTMFLAFLGNRFRQKFLTWLFLCLLQTNFNFLQKKNLKLKKSWLTLLFWKSGVCPHSSQKLFIKVQRFCWHRPRLFYLIICFFTFLTGIPVLFLRNLLSSNKWFYRIVCFCRQNLKIIF